MITLRPGSHVYRLLLLLAIAGEYPMRSLHLLGSSRTLEDLVHRLEHVQDFRTSTGADLGSCKMITTSGGASGGQSGCIRVRSPSCRPSIRQPSHTI